MNTFNSFHKIAAAPVAAAAAGLTLGTIGKELYGGLKRGISAVGKTSVDIAKQLPPHGMLLLALGGLGAGYGLARLTNPRVVAKNSDKLLEAEALATEIEVTEERLKALEARRRVKRDRARTEQQYDRFV